jgi:elongation factor Tu
MTVLLQLLTIIDVSVTINWPENTDAFKENKMVLPGDNVELVCEMRHSLALEKGMRFNVREGGRTVATGLVTQILE